MKATRRGSLKVKGLNPADNFSRAVIAPNHPATVGVQLRGTETRRPHRSYFGFGYWKEGK